MRLVGSVPDGSKLEMAQIGPFEEVPKTGVLNPAKTCF